jgi:hypothetical protein
MFSFRNGYSTLKRAFWETDSDTEDGPDQFRRVRSPSEKEIVIIDDEEDGDDLGRARAGGGKETIVIDDDEEHGRGKGAGTQDEPIYFPEWITGSLISKADHRRHFEVGDDKNDENYFTASEGGPSRSPSPVVTTNKDLQLNRFVTPVNKAPNSNNNIEDWNSVWQRAREAATSSGRRRTSRFEKAVSEAPESEDEIDDENIVSICHRSQSVIDSEEGAIPLSWRTDPFRIAISETPEPNEELNEDIDLAPDQHGEANEQLNARDSSPASVELYADHTSTRLGTLSEDPEDELPGLTFSQSSQLTESSVTPSSSQNFIGDLADDVQESPEIQSLKKETRQGCGYENATPSNSDRAVTTRTEDADEEASKKEEKTNQLKEKKRTFYLDWAPANLRRLESRLQTFRPLYTDPGKCWIYTDGKYAHDGTVRISIDFKHNGRGSYTVNVGFVALLVEGLLSEDAINGIINHSWHASHRCGNWRCTNPAHLVAEPGRMNISRNTCLNGNPPRCPHEPRCLTEFKIKEPKKIRKMTDDETGKIPLAGELPFTNTDLTPLDAWDRILALPDS